MRPITRTRTARGGTLVAVAGWEPPAQKPPLPGTGPTIWLTLFTVVSWLGLFLHNEVDLPQLTPLSVENSVPALMSVALLVGWWQLRGALPATIAMLTWSSLNLVGAVVTVLPLPFLPFEPEQTVLHYLMHVIYATSQVPLIGALVAWWSRTRATRG